MYFLLIYFYTIMKKHLVNFIRISLFSLFFSFSTHFSAKENINWKEFIAKQDLLWNVLPQAWDEGPFMGNGVMGTYICKEPNQNAIRVDVGQANVHDHRKDLSVYGRARLLVGHFTLEPVGEILSGAMRLDLWNAETIATIQTTKGEIRLRALVTSGNMAILVQADATKGEEDFKWIFHPGKADSPRQINAVERKVSSQIKKDYIYNPEPICSDEDGINLCYQPLLEGGSTTTAWVERNCNNKRLLTITTAHTYPKDNSMRLAVKDLKRIERIGFDKLVSSHRNWWHAYYPESFVSLPDKKLENFYWIQMYKLACATRTDGAIIDNCGPWLIPTPWPNAWWNLNVQLSYWSVYTSNRLHLGESLVKAVHNNQQNLINSVPLEYRYNSAGLAVATGFDLAGNINTPGSRQAQVGLLPWTCHNLWLQYRFSMDESILRNTIYPVLTRAINYYLHFLKEGKDGKLHMPPTYSPEYDDVADCNFDLSLLRWGCETLIESAKILKINDPLIPTWKNTLAKLTDYPQNDKEGFMIGKDMPYAYSHRHYSHLLMVYPLYLVNADQVGSRELVNKSVKHWFSMPNQLKGYSLTGASSIAASFGDGDESLSKLNDLFSMFLRPNTLYKEGNPPVMETPLSGAQCIHDMLIQSWGGKIRVFPAVPTKWDDLVFDKLRTQGAFLVSAKRVKGKTSFIQIKSLAGEPCVIKTDMINPTVCGNQTKKLKKVQDDVYTIDLKKGEEIVLTPSGVGSNKDIMPVHGVGQNYFGMH